MIQELFSSPCRLPAVKLLERQLLLHGNWKGSYNLMPSQVTLTSEELLFLQAAFALCVLPIIWKSSNRRTSGLNPVLRWALSLFSVKMSVNINCGLELICDYSEWPVSWISPETRDLMVKAFLHPCLLKQNWSWCKCLNPAIDKGETGIWLDSALNRLEETWPAVLPAVKYPVCHLSQEMLTDEI